MENKKPKLLYHTDGTYVHKRDYNRVVREVKALKDQVKWLEFNLAQANKEVRKGREIIEFVERNDPHPDLSADKYRDAYWRVRAKLEEFYASYID